jgi:transposase
MVCDICKTDFDNLLKRIDDLEKKLLAYENAHTPSSKLRFPPRIINENKQKPGQKIGHIGITRNQPDPTMSLELVEDKCPHCENKFGSPFKTISKIIEEIPEPQPIDVIEYKINHYKCKKCGKITVTQAPIPSESKFGPNTLAHVTLLKFDDRLPLKKVCNALARQFNLKLSSATVLDMTRRVSDSLLLEYDKLKSILKNSKVVYADETGMRVNGLNYHLWVFTNHEVTLYVIRKSRGKNVIEEILGTHFKGIISSDGWASYATFTNKLQRCWAHLLREAKYLAEKYESAKSLYEGLKKLFEKAKKTIPFDKNMLIIEMKQWIECANAYKELRKFAGKMLNGIEHWFTFVDYPFVEPTNNRAERALRELIVQRKIFGTLRNEKGCTIMERVNSCIVSWKQNGLNPFTEIKSRLC